MSLSINNIINILRDRTNVFVSKEQFNKIYNESSPLSRTLNKEGGNMYSHIDGIAVRILVINVN